MKARAFGRTGVDLPTIGQGTWDMPETGTRSHEAQRAIRRGLELGMTHIDTAEMYGSGRVEALIGAALRGMRRDRYFIATKVLPANASYRGTRAAAEGSIGRLGCGYLDLLLLHWPGSHPLEDTMRAFDDLVEQGKVRFVGVSNFEPEEMLKAESHLRAPLACNQVYYNLNERGIEHRLVPLAHERGIAIVAYTPFGRGQFLRSGGPARDVLEGTARKHGTTVHQVALAFLTREAHVFAIPKAASVAHVEENAAAGALELEPADLAAIDAAFPRGRAGPLATI
ncbi:MAG TPA: aldo/keto reductase [Candidatus Cybelea sp.]